MEKIEDVTKQVCSCVYIIYMGERSRKVGSAVDPRIDDNSSPAASTCPQRSAKPAAGGLELP